MMRASRSKKVLSIIVVLSLLLTQTVPGKAADDPRRVRVAFLGVRFENVDTETEHYFTKNILELLTRDKALDVVPPAEARQRLSESRIVGIFSNPVKDSLLALSEDLQVDYLFLGELSNQSRDPQRPLLVGTFLRFDRSNGANYVLEIAVFRQSLFEEIIKINEQLVKPILPPPDEPFFKRYLVLIIIGGITIGGLILLLLSSGKGGGEGIVNAPPTPG